MDELNDYIIHFLARKESPEDVQKLKEWLAADPAHHDELKLWLATWDAAGMMDVAEKVNPDKAYQRFIFRLNGENLSKSGALQPQSYTTHTNTLKKIMPRVAAAVVIGFILGLFGHSYWTAGKPVQSAFVENIVPLGSKSEIKLPDGSTVWLNAGSKLRYPTDYGKTTRDIYLVGEGYFKVAKQPDKPFTVHTALSNVRALGTEFNVKAYPEENVVETTLITGEVVVEKGEKGGGIEKNVRLKPGQKLLVSADTGAEMKEAEKSQPDNKTAEQAKNIQPVQSAVIVKQLAPDRVDAEVSWKEPNWHIESELLQNLAVKIERRYDVRIQVDDRLKNYRFSGTIKDESLEQVLNAIQLTAPILFKVDGKIVYIYADTKK